MRYYIDIQKNTKKKTLKILIQGLKVEAILFYAILEAKVQNSIWCIISFYLNIIGHNFNWHCIQSKEMAVTQAISAMHWRVYNMQLVDYNTLEHCALKGHSEIKHLVKIFSSIFRPIVAIFVLLFFFKNLRFAAHLTSYFNFNLCGNYIV